MKFHKNINKICFKFLKIFKGGIFLVNSNLELSHNFIFYDNKIPNEDDLMVLY